MLYDDLTTNELLKLSTNDLRNYLKKLYTKSNRKIENIKKTGLYSPAINYVESKYVGGKFSIKNVNKYKNQSSYKSIIVGNVLEARNFINSKTSSIKGVNEYNSKLINFFGEELTFKESQIVGKVLNFIHNNREGLIKAFNYRDVIETALNEYRNDRRKTKDIGMRVVKLLDEQLKQKYVNDYGLQ